MTPLFWIALTWVLATVFVSRLPLHQRFLPGALLAVTALPIVISIGVQVGLIMALLAIAAIISLFPNFQRLIMARYRGEDLRLDTNALRYLVMPGEL